MKLKKFEEKFEDDKVHGPDVEDLFYMSLKVKIKESHSITSHETNLDGIFMDVACILFIPNNSDDYQSQCGRK